MTEFDPSGGVIHFAGAALRAVSIIRQRCAWCGALISETDLDRVAWQVGEDGQNAENPFINDDGTPKDQWQGLVWVSDGNPRIQIAVPHSADGTIPVGSCMDLEPEVTR
jgi:hypothetical protein